ncbi:MAG: ribbon-helix-helix protein, CopG family [Thermoplasmatota archaeon]
MVERNVQTVLPEDVYESLARTARREGRPLKAVVRDAVEAYVRAAEPPDKDPLLAFVGKGHLKEKGWSTRKDWRG